MSVPGTVAVIGMGYIGLPTAAILASNGVRVIGVDVSELRVQQISSGNVPFVEPDLATHVAGAVVKGLLSAQTCTPEADCYIVAVSTPFAEGHTADLSHIRQAADGIAPRLRGGELIILESTSPPRTTRMMANWIMDARPDLSFDGSDGRPIVDFVHGPERVLPGRVMVELVTNDRIVGGLTPRAGARAKELYELFCRGAILLTDAETAEMTKLVENAFRDVNIAFANELSIICDTVGVDVWELIALANHHPRVNILQPGPGVGGHCIAVDPWFIVSADRANAKLIRTARQVNDEKPNYVYRRIMETVAGVKQPTVAMLGLAFKPDIEDLRESPALAIVERFANARPDAQTLAVEPHIAELPPPLASKPNVILADAKYALETADVVVVLVAHTAFRRLRNGIRAGTAVLDTKGLW